mmetsp:Transcript_16795/g.20171  ORF Transcript_16795/g.20171 Transcript_16795/m.20171 type:complete len:498 (-) Transcript_16795:280-1773(-)|eukprot:jgi/Bigna1/50055/estExt_Genewise1.C_650043
MSIPGRQAVKLCTKNLTKLGKKTQVSLPVFNREGVSPGIVHLGVGGFHRSHQAVYTAKALTQDPSWGICGVGLVPADKKMEDALASQDHLYTLLTKNSKSTEIEVIGSIVDYLYNGEGARTYDVMKKLAHEDTKIVSLTVTEKAYMIDDSTGDLDESHPLIQHDLENFLTPKTPIGYVVAGLRLRMFKNMPAFTVLSCDNLPMNGELTEKAVLQYAEKIDSNLAAWIRENTAFPSTMVDRITPATTAEDIALIKENYGIEDAWPVCAEDYTQWVIEDNFPSGRPAWEAFGALLVEDVKPYELMKLRLLNGSHSALAYLSYLAGHRRVHEAMQNDDVFQFMINYMETITPTVPEVPGVDLNAYKGILRERFSNPNISDQVSRLAEDGSKKIVSFVRDATEELLAEGQPTKHVAGAVAGWIRYSQGMDMKGEPIHIQDPKAEELKHFAHRVKGEGVGPFLSNFMGDKVASSEKFSAEVTDFVSRIESEGPKAVLKSLAE